MRKEILIPMILAGLLAITNMCQAGITSQERNKFDYHLKQIENRQKTYQARKDSYKRQIEIKKEQNKAKLKRKKQLESIAIKNKATARQYEINATNERVRNLKRGQCTVDTITGFSICK